MFGISPHVFFFMVLEGGFRNHPTSIFFMVLEGGFIFFFFIYFH